MDGIRTNQPSIDIFLQVFAAQAEQQSGVKKAAAYKALGRADPEGLQPMNRRVLVALHPDASANRSNRVDTDKLFKTLRDGYTAGRDAYLVASPFDQAEALQRNDLPRQALAANQVADASTVFQFDPNLKYDPSMGDVFYHPQRDKRWIVAERTVPGDLEFAHQSQEMEDGQTKVTVFPPGVIHACFRDFEVAHPTARRQFINLCLEAQHDDLLDIVDLLGYVEDVLVEDGRKIDSMGALVKACEDMHKRDYLKSFGVWDRIDDVALKGRVDDFLAQASIPEVYLLAGFIVDACIEHRDLPANEVVEKAKLARRLHDAGDALREPGSPRQANQEFYDDDVESVGSLSMGELLEGLPSRDVGDQPAEISESFPTAEG